MGGRTGRGQIRTVVGTIQGYAPLLVVYVLMGIAAWVWVFSARPGHRHQHRDFRRQRSVQLAGGVLIAATVTLAVRSGFVDTRGAALALGLIAIAAQLILVLFFTMARIEDAGPPSVRPSEVATPEVATPEPIPTHRYVQLPPPRPEPVSEEVEDVVWRRRTPRRL